MQFDHYATVTNSVAKLIVVSHHLQALGKPCQQGSSDLHQTPPKILSAFYNETETL